jgi:hypothetical protein
MTSTRRRTKSGWREHRRHFGRLRYRRAPFSGESCGRRSMPCRRMACWHERWQNQQFDPVMRAPNSTRPLAGTQLKPVIQWLQPCSKPINANTLGFRGIMHENASIVWIDSPDRDFEGQAPNVMVIRGIGKRSIDCHGLPQIFIRLTYTFHRNLKICTHFFSKAVSPS